MAKRRNMNKPAAKLRGPSEEEIKRIFELFLQRFGAGEYENEERPRKQDVKEAVRFYHSVLRDLAAPAKLSMQQRVWAVAQAQAVIEEQRKGLQTE